MRSPRSSPGWLHSLVLPWWDSMLRKHSISPLDSLFSPPSCSLQSLVSFFAWLASHNAPTILTSRIFVRGMPFDIHIRGLPHEISQDIACHGTAPSSVSANEADWASLGYVVDQRMDPIQATADAERSMVGISGTYERLMEQALGIRLLRVSWEGVLIVTLGRAHPSWSGVPER